MKKAWLGTAVFWLSLTMPMPASLAEAQEGSKVPIKITTEAPEIAPADDGGRPPSFVIET